MKTLVLGLGNDLLGDDAIGIIAAREVAKSLGDYPEIEVRESSFHGMALLEVFLGFERAIIIDAIQTKKHPPGTVIELTPDDLRPIANPSPHYTGLPEMMIVARQLDLDFPSEFEILAVEVEDPYTIGKEISDSVKSAIPEIINKVRRIIGRKP